MSEVNELIKGKRNITVQWDILLSALFDDPEQKWSRLQLEYDYHIAKGSIDTQKLQDIKTKRTGNQQEEKLVEKTTEKQEKKPVKDKTKEHEIFRNF